MKPNPHVWLNTPRPGRSPRSTGEVYYNRVYGLGLMDAGLKLTYMMQCDEAVVHRFLHTFNNLGHDILFYRRSRPMPGACSHRASR